MCIVEVTGISGVGKSYFLSILRKDKNNLIYDTDIVKKYNLTDLKLIIIFIKSNNAIKIFSLLVKISFNLKFSYFDKVNFIRNSIKKIAKNIFFKTLDNRNCLIVDEGITHMYQNIVNDNIISDNTIILVDKLMLSLKLTNNIIIIKSSEEKVYERLLARGHKRIGKKFNIKKFIKNGNKMINKIELNGNFMTVVVDNETKIDMLSFYKKFESLK